MATFKTIEVDGQGHIIKIRNRFTAELAANGQGRISWTAADQLAFMAHLARTRAHPDTLDNDEELRNLVERHLKIDLEKIPAARHRVALRKKVLTALRYRLARVRADLDLQEVWDEARGCRQYLWPEDVVERWSSPDWKGDEVSVRSYQTDGTESDGASGEDDGEDVHTEDGDGLQQTGSDSEASVDTDSNSESGSDSTPRTVQGITLPRTPPQTPLGLLSHLRRTQEVRRSLGLLPETPRTILPQAPTFSLESASDGQSTDGDSEADTETDDSDSDASTSISSSTLTQVAPLTLEREKLALRLLAAIAELEKQMDGLALAITHLQMRVWAGHHDQLPLLGGLRNERACLERWLAGLAAETRQRGLGWVVGIGTGYECFF